MSDIESRLKATIMDELAEWDDEFETPKWSAHTRNRMAEAIRDKVLIVIQEEDSRT
jgi:hypothetical protein